MNTIKDFLTSLSLSGGYYRLDSFSSKKNVYVLILSTCSFSIPLHRIEKEGTN